MTNASKVSFASVLSVVMIASVLSFGAFATIAHAQDDTYDEYFTPDSGTSDSNVGYVGLGNGSDTYDEYFTPNSSDTYDEYFSPNGSDTYDEYFSPNSDVTDTWDTTDVYGNTVTDQSGVGYSYENYANSNSSGYNQNSASQPFSQSFPQAPRSFSAPAVSYPSQVVYQAQQQQQQQQIRSVAQPSNITTTTNTCTNNSCNYTDNSNNSVNISNSGNTQTTVYPISQSYPQYPVQYTPPQQTYNNVLCYISSSQNYGGNYGQNVYLSWSSSGATSAWLSSVGSVAPTGTMAVNGSGTYTLTVSGPNGSNTCSTNVVAQSYPSVSLSQIPYTGFDFGPVGNALYWLSLLAFAAAGAYLLVYYKGGMSLLMSGAVARTTSSVVSAPARIVKSTAQKIEKAITDDKPMLANLPVMPAALATVDSMAIAHSKDGSAPRIIITRS